MRLLIILSVLAGILIFNCNNNKVMEETESELIIYSVDGKKLTITGEAKTSFHNLLVIKQVYYSDSLSFVFSKVPKSEPPPPPDDLEDDSTAYVIDMPEHYVVTVYKGEDFVVEVALNLDRNKILHIFHQL